MINSPSTPTSSTSTPEPATLDGKTGFRRYPAGAAHYPGDVTGIVGEVKGPPTYGGSMLATSAVYDRGTDRTRVEFAHCTPYDVMATRELGDGMRRLVFEADPPPAERPGAHELEELDARRRASRPRPRPRRRGGRR